MKLPPEVVVVTGASAGVGRAIVERFARERISIALLARGEKRLAAAARGAEALGSRALALPVDVADADAVEAAAERVERELGPIDVWVNNAMATVFAPVRDVTPEEYRRATEVTYHGTVWGTMAALRRMVPRDRGAIVQVGSALAYRSIPLQAPYCGAKHAVHGFTETLRTELKHDRSHVHVTMVQLPAHNTPQFDWGRTKLPRAPQPVPPIFQPEVAAEAVWYAATHRRRELFVAWPSIKAILGERVAPGLLDTYLARNGYDAQQADEPVSPDRPDNLFAPAPGNHGAHGRFDDQAKGSSPVVWLDLHRGLIAGAAAAAGAAVLATRVVR
jgi:NAD(P)-dependent dehydrogenase (short-subunit alcohol dehydrogenase family)